MRKLAQIRPVQLVLVLLLWAGFCCPPPTQAAEKLTSEQVAGLLPQLFRLHLKQREMDAPFTKRLLKDFVNQLDASKHFYLKDEAEALINLPDAQLQRISEQSLNGDLSHFQKILENFLGTQIARDTALYNGLDKRLDEIKALAQEKKKTPAAGDNEGEVDDESERAQWRERPATTADHEKRLLRSAAGLFGLNKTYLSENEGFRLAIQTLRDERNKWLKVNVDEEVPKLFLKSFMGAMDPHTDYFDADEDEFTERLEASFAGIGVQIRPCPLGAQIEDIIKGGPTERSGKFARGDQLIAVDDVSLAGLQINKVVKRIKGKIGTDVKLTILKRATRTTESVVLKRDKIELAELRVKGKKFETEAGTIGLVSVQTFYKGVHRDVRERMRELAKDKPLAGVVLDLRFNHGGYLEEAVALAGLFLEGGAVVGERDGADQIDWKEDPDVGAEFVGPLVVLVNQFSASASEIVAGTLKDYGRAVIVGATQTFGKGTVQRVIPLSTLNLPGEIKITTHQYFLAGGASVQLKGVEPDVTIPGPKLLDEDGMLERASENAVPFNRIKGELDSTAPAVKLWMDWKAKHVALLQEQSKLRVDADPKFKDAFDSKKKPPTADAAPKPLPANPDEPPPLSDDKKEPEDLQAQEAAAVAKDIATSWPQVSAQVAK